MMQELGVTLEIIDRCQNHLLGGSKVRRHYLHHDYAKEKTEAWRALGERLEEILTTDVASSSTSHIVLQNSTFSQMRKPSV
ncbi:hypothetical protein Q043_02086 [Pseudomonas aeruginosa BWHPSA038]|nr:hypothetical protein Q043_02086 [Pseudomonas aeruginosa BWHPSA038]